MSNKKKNVKYLIINNYGVVYNKKTKTITVGNRVQNGRLIIDYTVNDVEEDDIEIAFILCHLLYPNDKNIVTSFGELVNKYSVSMS